jgi:hypothetical protein
MDDIENLSGGSRHLPDCGKSSDEANGAMGEEAMAPGFAGAQELGDILHDLNNVLVSILLNAQVIGWKLPSYSRIRRNVHEAERSAQRGAVLVNRLKQWAESRASCSFGRASAPQESMGMRRSPAERSEKCNVPNSDAPRSDGPTTSGNRKKVPHTMV